MRVIKYVYYMCDFETTVYDGQERTDVWCAALTKIGDESEKVDIYTSIDSLFEEVFKAKKNVCIYWHNLKFDGSFILDWLLHQKNFSQGYLKTPEGDGFRYSWLKETDMPSNTFKYLISSRGQWYSIHIKKGKHHIEIRDSVKLIPRSIKDIGETFGVKRRKTDIEYEGYREPGGEIKPDEVQYIENDVLIPSEALNIMMEQGHTKSTIGSCCLNEYKKIIGKEDFALFFPDLTEIKTPFDGYRHADDFIRKAYGGGWCYLKDEHYGKKFTKGITLDVNSLYPSMMHSSSGNKFPIGKPEFWVGSSIPEDALKENRYYFINFKCRFKVKEGYLPFVQIKRNLLYNQTEHLKTSDIYDKKQDRYCRYYTLGGEIFEAKPELHMTCTEYELFKEHYDVYDEEIIGGCYFHTLESIFDEYIDKFMEIKITSVGVKRELAKLFLNNLYGKLGTGENSSFKVAYLNENDEVKFIIQEEYNKKTVHVACAAAITAYSRRFTITHAQANYERFIYADTDSLHIMGQEPVRMCLVHPKKLSCWKLESKWDEAIFVRQKTYIEIEGGKWDIKCAGMPERAKYVFRASCKEKGITIENGYLYDRENKLFKVTDEMEEYIKENQNTIESFKINLKVPGKLTQKRIRGGIILKDGIYTLHERKFTSLINKKVVDNHKKVC